jgi:hypothetical protein
VYMRSASRLIFDGSIMVYSIVTHHYGTIEYQAIHSSNSHGRKLRMLGPLQVDHELLFLFVREKSILSFRVSIW